MVDALAVLVVVHWTALLTTSGCEAMRQSAVGVRSICAVERHWSPLRAVTPVTTTMHARS